MKYNQGLLLSVFLHLVYNALSVRASGRTFGKRAVGLRVVSSDGTAVTARQAWIRAVVESGLNLVTCLGPLANLAVLRFLSLTLHDLAAKTQVVVAHGTEDSPPTESSVP